MDRKGAVRVVEEGGSPHSLLKVIRLSRPGIRGNGGPTEEMVIPKAVTHRKGIHHPLDVCVCVFTMMSSHQSPRLSATDGLGTDVLLSAVWVVICRGRGLFLSGRCHLVYRAQGRVGLLLWLLFAGRDHSSQSS